MTRHLNKQTNKQTVSLGDKVSLLKSMKADIAFGACKPEEHSVDCWSINVSIRAGKFDDIVYRLCLTSITMAII